MQTQDFSRSFAPVPAASKRPPVVGQFPSGAIAIFALDGDLSIRSVNAAGRSLQRAGTIAELRFATADRELNQKLRHWARHDMALFELRLSLEDEDGGVLSIVASATEGEDDDAAAGGIVVLVQEQKAAVRQKLANVVRDHDLTAAEARVAALIVTGKNTVAVARKLGIARSTVRTHLQRILAKTDTHRQSEFAYLVANYAR